MNPSGLQMHTAIAHYSTAENRTRPFHLVRLAINIRLGCWRCSRWITWPPSIIIYFSGQMDLPILLLHLCYSLSYEGLPSLNKKQFRKIKQQRKIIALLIGINRFYTSCFSSFYLPFVFFSYLRPMPLYFKEDIKA